MMVTGSWGEGELWSYYFIGIQFQFRKMKNEFCGWMVAQQYEYT